MKFGGSAPPPPPPQEEPEPIRIPSPTDPDMVAARKLKMRQFASTRGGRASTVLSSGSSGGGDYSRTTLG